MADPNEPTHSPRGHDAQDEVLDAEIVDEPRRDDAGRDGPAAGASGFRDDEEYRQYQEFLEFQKFREWQRNRSDGARTSFTGETKRSREPQARPRWKRALGLLRYKTVRRLLYLLVAVLFAWWLLHYLLGDIMDNGDSTAPDGGTPGKQDFSTAPIPSADPATAVAGVYNYVAYNRAGDACALFNEAGRQAFADSYGAASCVAAVQRINADVADPVQYPNIKIGRDAETTEGGNSSVSSCGLDVQGGPRLGMFHLTQNAKGGWLIAGHEHEPADCLTG
ncbi:hypothetical protein GIY23_20370 [Allosaccharopolyspora coralli]|uniref:Uncharacterized protein n=1 Tax=Allosaccharopolyspora coralli TaxID=2665642 RepID=A0A5Q3QL46_9PSEU|nr:hypothetical protein [Allosaccharopolyspora coralli]QGK71557.1 hypothetical protein GIY23_20370 [Allosaccharopolyspora coralli]